MSRFGQGFEEPEEGLQIKARLKWFNATKGFGFVSPVDGDSDAFLHVSVLHRAGLQSLGDQAELLCEVGSGPKGPQVTRIVEVLDHGVADGGGGAQPRMMDAHPHEQSYGGHPPKADGYGQMDGFGSLHRGVDPAARKPVGPEEQASGMVKWFKADKGFGFITIDGSGQDVFVHKSVLQRSGVIGLDAGQRVELRVQEVEKGHEATWVTLV